MRASGARWVRHAAAAFDPYLAWSIATEFKGHAALQAEPEALLALLVKLRDPSALLPEGCQRSALYSGPDMPYQTLWVPRDRLAALLPAVELIELAQPIRNTGLKSGAAAAHRSMKSQSGSVVPPGNEAAGAVPLPLLVVIDRGEAVLNQAFCQAWGGPAGCQTRLVAYWDQTRAAAAPWRTPALCAYGRELDASAINSMLARIASGQCSEAQAYRELGLLAADDLTPLPVLDHGSFVLDCLGGLPRRNADAAVPAQPDLAGTAPLLMVRLPEAGAGDTTCGPLSAYILDALHYALAQARPGQRVLVNLSVGLQGGPHDGSSLLEQAIEALQQAHPELCIVIAGGNGGGVSSNAAGPLDAKAEASVDWQLLPDDVTDSFLELWWQDEQGQSVQAQPPFPAVAGASPWLKAGEAASLIDAQGRLLAVLQAQPALGGLPARALLALAPSGGARAGLPAGRWRLALRAAGQAKLPSFRLWVQGDQPHSPSGDPQQSWLDGASNAELGGAGTLNGIATGRSPWVVGAAQLVDNQASGYTSRGPSSGRDIDLLATADAGPIAVGLCASGVFSGSLYRMSGSSVAAPVAARQLAKLLAELPLGAPSRLLRTVLAPGQATSSKLASLGASLPRSGGLSCLRPDSELGALASALRGYRSRA